MKMSVNWLLKMVLGLIVIITCCDMKTLSFTLKLRNQKDQTLPSDIEVDINPETTEPSSFLEKISKDIKNLENSNSSSSGSDEEIIEKDENGDATNTKSRRRVMQNKKNILGIMDVPTNTMRAYLKSKTGVFLRMKENGELDGTPEIKDSYIVFVIEVMKKGVVRLRGEKAGRYICINKRQRIVTKSKPVAKCLLRNYLEENHYELFWSYIYSKNRDGENGWFLALRQNGRIRKPLRTKIGETTTMFYIHRIKK